MRGPSFRKMPEQPLNRQDESVCSKLLSQLPRLILTWILVSYVANMFLSPKNDIPLPVPTDGNSIEKAKPPTILHPIYRLGDKLDLYFYLNDQDHFFEFDNSEKLLLLEKNITFGDYNDVRARDFKLPCDARLQNNGSLYAHFFIVKAGTPLSGNTDKDTLLYHRKSLARLMPPRKNVKRKNLIKGANETETIPEPISKDWIRYWWPNVTLAIVTADTPLGTNMPPQIMKKLLLDTTKTKYKPIFYTNDFWMLQEALIPINNTVERLDIFFTFSPMSMWKFQLYVQFEESFRLQVDVMGLDVAEHDQMKVLRFN